MIEPTIVPESVVENTLMYLRLAGTRRSECVVLWLARREADAIRVVDAYRPDQVAEEDFFRIPPSAMQAVMRRVGDSGLLIASQVHSHPREAFHSRADDQWAIVRHLDALSIVVPYFAAGVGVGDFLASSAVFRLGSDNRWRVIPKADLPGWVRIL